MRKHCKKHRHQHQPDCPECSQILKELKRIEAENAHIEKNLETILKSLKHQPITAVITQGVPKMLTGTILGLAPGASDTFFVTPVDANGDADALPAGSPVPTITADDSTVVLVVAPDGLSAQVTADPGATAGSSFNLNWAASYTDASGNQQNITATANVPVLQGTTPVQLPTTGVISQGSPAA